MPQFLRLYIIGQIKWSPACLADCRRVVAATWKKCTFKSIVTCKLSMLSIGPSKSPSRKRWEPHCNSQPRWKTAKATSKNVQSHSLRPPSIPSLGWICPEAILCSKSFAPQQNTTPYCSNGYPASFPSHAKKKRTTNHGMVGCPRAF